MPCSNCGTFGTIFRKLLIIINGIFFTLGFLIVISAGFVYFNSPNIQKDLHLSIALFILGVAILIVCTIGLIGFFKENRLFLVIYEVLLIVYFIVHLVLLIIAVDKLMDELKNYFGLEVISKNQYRLIVSNSVLLAVELFFIITTPFYIIRISKNDRENPTAV